MNCFYHPERNAVGTCKVCSKGLCIECAADLGHSLACKDKHETEANSINKMITMNVKAHEEAPKNLLIMPAFFVFMGAVISGYCIYYGKSFTNSSTIMGLGFIFFGLLIWFRNRKIYKDDA